MAEQQQQREYMTVAEAQHELGVHKRKMADLIKRGNLPAEENPFDRRSKLVRRADVAALKAKMPTPARDLAKSAA